MLQSSQAVNHAHFVQAEIMSVSKLVFITKLKISTQ